MNLSTLTTTFPQHGKNNAITGKIPMEYFTENEKAIRTIMKEHKLRSFYRGKRNRGSNTTCRRNAHSIVLYNKFVPFTCNKTTSSPARVNAPTSIKGPGVLLTILFLLATAMMVGVIEYQVTSLSGKPSIANKVLDESIAYYLK